MSALWTASDMAEAMAGRPFGPSGGNVTGISIDSRTLKPGDAFFAIKGENFDGHDFAGAATAAGAALLVVAEGRLPALGRIRIPLIVVSDVLQALEKLGMAARERSRAKVIAVTGSAGKTTTKEALRHALSACGNVHASAASFNNHWGVPLTLARMPAETDFAVFEIGMNHPGEIRPLVKMVRPNIAIVTLIAAAHLGHFKNLEEIARAKAEIFEGLLSGGIALINRDDAHFPLLKSLANDVGVGKIVGFGENAQAEVRLLDWTPKPGGSSIFVRVAGKDMSVEIGAPGRHIVQNVLAVLGAARFAGADLAKVGEALATLEPEAGRGKQHRLRIRSGTFTLIDESYNANPASMKAALDLLATTLPGEGGRRIAVLGDMLELGEHSGKLHAGLARLVAGKGIDRLLLGGTEMKALAAVLPADISAEHHQSAADLKSILLTTVRPGDVVMIKSSKSIGFSKLVDALIQTFPADDADAKTA